MRQLMYVLCLDDVRTGYGAHHQLDKTSQTLPALLDETQSRLQEVLSTAQQLSLERHSLEDQLSGLSADLRRGVDDDASQLDGATKQGEGIAPGRTLLEHMATLHEELAGLEAGLAWARILESALLQR